MQKKLEAELMGIAHSILQMKNRDDLKALKQKAYETYEKIAVLSYIEDFVKETPQNTKTVEELVEETFSESRKEVEEIKETPKVDVEKVEEFTEETEEPTKVVNVELVEETLEVVEDKEEVVVNVEEPKEEPSLDLFTKAEENKEDKSTNLQSSLAKEFGSTVSLDVATDLFENATRVAPKKSLNDVAMGQKNLQIDLNDRIAFVKHLFDDSQEDFNRVVSQLNTMSSEKEALSFLKMVKKEYNWAGKEIYEDRLILLIERKFN
ncbi:hypothetical protein [Wenyingzhuangia marina]|uniref:Uncharacterized protein n=1 Tax=Wenyingzhuangia marina TaxID=1195760 RepID=A0A1M5SHN4_9FLAO|nr:hypothetical protein [Wenyingzhuangia marina]GGF62328.1 hypothetical protein GCM10011397_01820 [Wenyingzhuangia marina]SHH38102.1 hypothetical protein SAMN05444281_0321 [Wenyingzhuangia marina]